MHHLVQCLTESVRACYSNANNSNPWLESCIGLQTWKGSDLQRIQVKSTGVCRAVEPQELHFRRTTCCQQSMQESPSHVLTDAPLTRIWICSPTVGALSLFLLTCNRSTRGRMVIPCSKTTKPKIRLSSHQAFSRCLLCFFWSKFTGMDVNHSYPSHCSRNNLVVRPRPAARASTSPLLCFTGRILPVML